MRPLREALEELGVGGMRRVQVVDVELAEAGET